MQIAFFWGPFSGMVVELLNPFRTPFPFGDKLLTVRVFCPHIWECGTKRVEGGAQKLRLNLYRRMPPCAPLTDDMLIRRDLR